MSPSVAHHVEAGAERAHVAEVAAGDDDHVGHRPSRTAATISMRDGLLALDAQAVHRVGEVDALVFRRAAARGACSRRSRCRPTSTSAPLASGWSELRRRHLAARQDDDRRECPPRRRRRRATPRCRRSRRTRRRGSLRAVGDHLPHDRDEHGHAEVLERPGVLVAALLDPQVLEADAAGRSARPRTGWCRPRPSTRCSRSRSVRRRPTPSCPRPPSRTATSCACSGRRTAASTRPASDRAARRGRARPRAGRHRSGSDRAAGRAGARPGSRRHSGTTRGMP